MAHDRAQHAPQVPEPEHHHHRNIQSGGARAAVFGISDGLVTNVSLVLGVGAAGTHPSFVRLAGLAGLVAGAFSMAAGEYVSMQAQRELIERELELERHSLHQRPDEERAELTAIYERRGIAPEVARDLVAEVSRDPEVALETHAREELGVNPMSLGSPWLAALSSFCTFALGALLPLLPWFVTSGTAAMLATVVIGAVAALAVGALLSRFTGRPVWFSALRQLGVAAVAAAVTFGIGRAVGVSGAA
jgi:VIT1/CCC1 family predicted Fe2+/Mn2+ transporter